MSNHSHIFLMYNYDLRLQFSRTITSLACLYDGILQASMCIYIIAQKSKFARSSNYNCRSVVLSSSTFTMGQLLKVWAVNEHNYAFSANFQVKEIKEIVTVQSSQYSCL